MKDNKNKVFALHSYSTTKDKDTKALIFSSQGFLLFRDEEKADSFLSMCKSINQLVKLTDYEKFEYVMVNDYTANKIEIQNQFYVPDIKNVAFNNLEITTFEKIDET